MKYKALILLPALLALASCGKKGQPETSQEQQPDFVVISVEQFSTGKMELSDPAPKEFEETVKCTGILEVQPSGMASVSSPVAGLVSKINCLPGEKVFAGRPLFEISGNEFIELQKDLAETAGLLKRTRTEYERIKTLYSEKVGSEKELIMAETEFSITNARYSALRMKMKNIGLDPERIEAGDFYGSFQIKSPLTGYVSQINVSTGEYADPQKKLTEVLDLSRLQLRLSVFEKDISRITEKQQVTFTLSGNRSVKHEAAIRSVGKDVDFESKSIICIADIKNLAGGRFVNDAFAEAEIITGSDTVTAIPEESVLKSGDERFILSLVKNDSQNYYFRKEKTETGRLKDGYVEILNRTETGKILTKGAYNIMVE